MATIREIAARAGVSPATVSRVLSMDKSFSVSDDTRARIFSIAEELQYQSDRKASRYTAKVALILLHEEAEELQNPYYLNIRLHIREAAQAERMQLTEHYCPGASETLPDLSACAGILVLGETARWTAAWEQAVMGYGVPVVLVDFCAGSSAADCVYVDPRQIVETALAALEARGIDRVGYIGAVEDVPGEEEARHDQREIFFIQHQKVRDRFRPEDIFTGRGATFESGYRIAGELLARGDYPTAFFVMNDSMAIGACRAFAEAGLRIPEDVELIGCNDIPSAAYHVPPLTTVNLHTPLLGTLSLRLLKDRIENGREGEVCIRILVPGELILRSSTKNTPA